PRPELRASALRRHALAPQRRQPRSLAAGSARPAAPGRLGEPARVGGAGSRTGRAPRTDGRRGTTQGRPPARLGAPGRLSARRAAARARLSVRNGAARLLPPHAGEPPPEPIRPGMGTDHAREGLALLPAGDPRRLAARPKRRGSDAVRACGSPRDDADRLHRAPARRLVRAGGADVPARPARRPPYEERDRATTRPAGRRSRHAFPARDPVRSRGRTGVVV